MWRGRRMWRWCRLCVDDDLVFLGPAADPPQPLEQPAILEATQGALNRPPVEHEALGECRDGGPAGERVGVSECGERHQDRLRRRVGARQQEDAGTERALAHANSRPLSLVGA